MKPLISLRTVLVAMVVLSGGWAMAQKSDRKAGKGTGQVAAGPEAKKEEEKEGKIVGVPISRAEGGFYGLAIENGGFRLNCYDAKKKPVKIERARATARWNPSQKAGQATAILQPTADGLALASSKFVQPPRIFKVYLTLFNAQGEVAETHVVDFRE